jgi:hypothetical protein
VGGSSISWEAVTAVATAVTAIGVPVSAVVIGIQLRQAKVQLRQTKEISQSQVYQNLLDRAERIQLNQALEAVRSLLCENYTDYSKLPEQTRNRVKVAVEFFNELRHMLPPDSYMLELDTVRSLWGLSILSCADKLWTRQAWLDPLPVSWWLEGLRAEQAKNFQSQAFSGYFYRGFERLCWRIKKLEDPDACCANWDLPDEENYW